MSQRSFSRIGTGFVLAVGLLLAAPVAMAQQVSIGGTVLELGASRADTLATANARFDLSPTRVDGQYNIYPKRFRDPGDNTYPPAIGTITIENNRLVRVTRNLGSFRSENAEKAIDNLITVFSRAPNRGDSPSIHTDTGLDGDASTSRVYFSYPDRAIQIVSYRPADRSGMATINITEQYALSGTGTPVVVQ